MINKITQKTFVVGDTWLYYKLYCGVQTADVVLTGFIQVLATELMAEKKILKWFFIRYTDPHPHIRVRFHIHNIEALGTIMVAIQQRLLPLLESKQLWDVQVATYQRELERYGTNTIEEAESFFFYDSTQILTIIKNSKDDETRFLQLFQWIAQILSLFQLEAEQQLSFLERMQAQFKSEFNTTKNVKKTLSAKYKALELQLHEDASVNFAQKEMIAPIVNQFLMLEKENGLEVSLESLLASYIHMSINRSFQSKQRLYEMMLYDFLYRKHNTQWIRYGN